MITIHEVEQGSPKWLEFRKDLYTGSNADKLLKHSGSVKIIDGVVSAYALAEITGFSGNFYTKRGHVLEDKAISLYQKIRNCEVMVSPEAGIVTNSLFPSCGYSPDGLIVEEIEIDDVMSVIIKKTIEVKAFKPELHLQLIKGDIPLKVLAQIHFGMLICGAKECDLLPYNPEFARKLDDAGNPNPLYDPKKAFKIVNIKYNPSIAQNFRRKLLPQKVAAA